MGQMRFAIPRQGSLVAGAAEQAYLAGAEGIPWECVVTQVDETLIIERDTRESGYLHFPWKVAGRGLVQLSSGSLMERPRAYHLPVELARGTLNRVRNQASQWQQAGMTIPAGFDALVHAASLAFGKAATGQHEPQTAQGHADEAIRLGLDAGDLLVREYTQQVLAIRRGQQASFGTLLGARVQAPLTGDAAKNFRLTFNTAAIGTFWPDIEPLLGKYQWDATDRLVEWAQEQDLRLCMGPLVQMDRHALPDWLFLDEDFEEVQLSVLSFVEAVVKRYRGKVHLWHVAAGMNLDGALEHTEEQRLRLVVEAVDRVRAVDPRTPLVPGPGADAAALCRHAGPRRAGAGGRGAGAALRLLAGGHAAARPPGGQPAARPLVADRRAADAVRVGAQQRGGRRAGAASGAAAGRSAR